MVSSALPQQGQKATQWLTYIPTLTSARCAKTGSQKNLIVKKLISYLKSTVLSIAKTSGFWFLCFFFFLHSQGLLKWTQREKEGKARERDLDSKKVSHSGTPKTSSLGDTGSESLTDCL